MIYIVTVACTMSDEIAGAYLVEADARVRFAEMVADPYKIDLQSTPAAVVLFAVSKEHVVELNCERVAVPVPD